MIGKADAYILDKHQSIANWAYTRWDVSPYWIAAQLSGAESMIILILGMIDYSLAKYTAAFFDGVLMLFGVVLFWRYRAADADWAAGRLRLPEIGHALSRRIGLVLIAFSLTATALLLAFAPQEIAWRERVVLLLYVAAHTSGLYFMSCSPPTYTHRREEKVALQPTI